MTVFKNKKILMICKEDFSYPLYYVTEKLHLDNKIATFWTLTTECRLNECLHNKYSYYGFKKSFSDVQIFDVKDIASEFIANFNQPHLDWEYIKELENHYTHYKGLNLQLQASQFTALQSHYRDFYYKGTEEQNIYWLQLNYKNLIKIMDEFNPDVIFDLDNAELHRTILNEICYKKHIPYITVSYSRFEKYILPTYNLGLKNSDLLVETYHTYVKNKTGASYQEAVDYIKEYREKDTIMPAVYLNTPTSQYKPSPVFKTIKELIGHFMYLYIDMDFMHGNFKMNRNKMLYPSSLKWLRFKTRYELKRQLLYRKNKYFENPVKNEPYVYMPLHLIPESTTATLAPLYLNELSNIEAVSKQLPLGWKLYVKEHQVMLGERSFDFYKKVKAIPNVRLVQLNYYKDPKDWIVNSKGVVTITGTGAYEAALLGKKAIVFGEVPFNLMDCISKASDYEKLSTLIKDFDMAMDTTDTAAAYLAAVKDLGSQLDITYMKRESLRLLQQQLPLTKNLDNEIGHLIEFYEKAYLSYKEQPES